MTFLSSPNIMTPPRLLTVLVAVWLLALSALIVVQYSALSELTDAISSDEKSGQLHSLRERTDRLEKINESLNLLPRSVTHAELSASHQPLDSRIAALELATRDPAPLTGLQPVQEQLLLLEAKLEAMNQPSIKNPAPRTSAKIQPAAPMTEPPFQVLGFELRGGERFLAIAPKESQLISQVRLMRIGESEGTWLLKDIEPQFAVFQVAGKTQRLAVP